VFTEAFVSNNHDIRLTFLVHIWGNVLTPENGGGGKFCDLQWYVL
jgi:hypothetical protein